MRRLMNIMDVANLMQNGKCIIINKKKSAKRFEYEAKQNIKVRTG